VSKGWEVEYASDNGKVLLVRQKTTQQPFNGYVRKKRRMQLGKKRARRRQGGGGWGCRDRVPQNTRVFWASKGIAKTLEGRGEGGFAVKKKKARNENKFLNVE